MAKDLGDTIGTAVGRVAREAAQNLTQNGRKGGKSPLGGMTGVALGAGLAAAAPLAVKGASKLKNLGNGAGPLQKAGETLQNPVQKAGEKLKGAASDVVDDKIKDAGGPGGIAKEGAKSLIPGLGGGDDDKQDEKGEGGGKNEADGAGKGRRMPVQQSVDIGVPVATVYNQFTQFEEWPKFMHRVTSVSQEDETHIAFKSKIWGVSKEFQAEIDEQRPDERVKWHVVEGLSHKGVVTFHELAPRLTRIEVNVDVEPGSLIEKFARGARHVKRAMRADLHRFKAYVMMNEEESGEWRGTIDEGEVKSSEKSSERSSAASSGSRTRRSSSKSDSGRAKAASSSSGRSRSSSGSSKRSSSGTSKRSPSGSSRSSSGSSKRSSSNSSSKRSGSSNGGDPSSRSSSRSSSGSSRRKSGSRS